MISFISSIVDFLLAVGSHILNYINSILWLINVIDAFKVTIFQLFAFCPTPLLIFIHISFSLTVFFAIIKLL